ncbi:hypothetical protein BJ322DRAFT_734692 [Thelephora terrestris]|uniref:Zn(2)-C6 fungal-type domain-containing protein n=1 Tax=Thelephora terrestris TaxID=56493 RepID=A0A9P6HEQ7_9AGAM|nr:hypothetical protein BJ322DRAFT_734692 [Thelephora terrestris]
MASEETEFDHLQTISDQQQQGQQQQQQPQTPQQQQNGQTNQQQDNTSTGGRKKGPSVRRACATCHAGKTRCSEVLPCQSCLKRGLGATCAYPEPDSNEQPQGMVPAVSISHFPPPLSYPAIHPSLAQSPYYDYNTFANPPPQPAPPPPPASTPSSTTTAGGTPNFRPNKRPRNLTEEETASITRNWTRGDFFIGNSSLVRVDPRLPVKLTLGEGDQVHFSIVGEPVI